MLNNRYEVFFVDYGDVEWIEEGKVYPVHESVLEVHEASFLIAECSVK